ncbi:MAG: hypothetical protein ACXQTY_07040 [Candidatus Methanogasteraceae archaeon]
MLEEGNVFNIYSAPCSHYGFKEAMYARWFGVRGELLLDLGGLVLRGVILMLACFFRQQLDGQNGVAALDALMILQAAVCRKVLFHGYF